MFRLMARKSKVPTHFYPLSMVSYELCPPPDTVDAATGELRNIRHTPVGIAVGGEVDNEGGLEARHLFCDRANDAVKDMYKDLRKQVFPE
jgi:glycerol-3-phosphate O-acyltransferase